MTIIKLAEIPQSEEVVRAGIRRDYGVFVITEMPTPCRSQRITMFRTAQACDLSRGSEARH